MVPEPQGAQLSLFHNPTRLAAFGGAVCDQHTQPTQRGASRVGERSESACKPLVMDTLDRVKANTILLGCEPTVVSH